MTEPFHPGEIAVQEQAGERDQAILNGRMIWGAIPAAARSFVRQQSYVALGWLDAAGAPWASLVVAAQGFASSDDSGAVVTIHASAVADVLPSAGDVTRAGAAVGMLFIDLATRRRLRVNGIVASSADGELRVAVEQAYPNCPKYIQKRDLDATPRPASPVATSNGVGVPPDLGTWLSRTDTAFVASVGPDGRIDCSHRGGRRGFMRMDGDTVVVPDYPGNSMFCTLGNMTAVPRAGLVLVDFDAQQQLHLSGDVSVKIASDGQHALTNGSGRRWMLTPRRWAMSPLGGAASWTLLDESPFNPPVEP